MPNPTPADIASDIVRAESILALLSPLTPEWSAATIGTLADPVFLSEVVAGLRRQLDAIRHKQLAHADELAHLSSRLIERNQRIAALEAELAHVKGRSA
jgi:hypothetical protein